MADDPIRTYLNARAALEQATVQARKVVEVIVDASEKLRDWRKVVVSNANSEFPAELLGGPTIDAHQWLSSQQLAGALAAWHEAHNAADAAWRAVPMTDKPGLQPPPE